MTAVQHRGLSLGYRIFFWSFVLTIPILLLSGTVAGGADVFGPIPFILMAVAGSCLVSSVFGIAVWLIVGRRIQQISDAMQRVSDGDLSAITNVPGSDEVAILAAQFNEMASKLRQVEEGRDTIAAQLKESVRKLSASSAEILKISNDQAANANEQASAVQEASTTSKEIAVTAKEITNNAVSVQDIAERSTDASTKGSESLKAATSSMKALKKQVETLAERMVELGENSQRIGGVLSIIEEISEQTNLLALNAAIEAAGAGEAGKRFGVVAQEVRRLAEKTVEATKQIQEIIEKIQNSTNSAIMVTEQGLKAVDSSFQLVQKVGDALKNIDAQVERTTRSAKEITFSTQQQTSACEQMAITIAEVSQVAEHFVKGTEETTEAIAELNDLAAHLKGMIR